MKHIYNKNGEFLLTTFDYIEDTEIKEAFGDCFIVNEKLKYPIVVDETLREMNNKEKFQAYQNKKYTLDYNEIIQDDEIVYYIPKEFEKIKKGRVIYDTERKKGSLLDRARHLKHRYGELGFIYKDNLRQPCREQDKTSFTAKVLELQFTKSPSTKWKFFDKDTNEHIYQDLTLAELIELGQRCSKLILNAMLAESKIIEELKTADVKTYDVDKKFKEYMGNEDSIL